MYERVVDVPRLVAELPDGRARPPGARAGRATALSRHYGLALARISLAYYRDGRDSVAWHGDRLGRLVDDTVVAILSLGEPRRFLLRRPRAAPRGPSISAGATSWSWAEPASERGSTPSRRRRSAGPRMSVQFRPDAGDAEG